MFKIAAKCSINNLSCLIMHVGKGTMLGWYSNYVDYGDDMWSWNFMVILVAMALSLRARGEHKSKWRGM